MSLVSDIKNYSLRIPCAFQSKEIAFIKNSIFSLFDGKISNSANPFGFCDGVIDQNEFKNVSKQSYEARVKEMQAYYKKENGRELQYHIPTYEEMKKMLQDNKTLKAFNKIDEQEFMAPITPNGVISQVNQNSYGECYQLAADIALSLTPKGKSLLSRSVKQTANGYMVTLYGAKDSNGNIRPKTYFISQAELKRAQEQNTNNKSLKVAGGYKRYSSGDADAVLLSLVIQQYRKEHGHVLRQQDKGGNGRGVDDYLSGGSPGKVIQLITGKHNSFKYFEPEGDVDASNTTKGKALVVNSGTASKKQLNDKQVVDALAYLSKNSSDKAICCSFTWKDVGLSKLGLHGSHAYAIKKIDIKNGKLYLLDPHNTQIDKTYNDSVIVVPIEEAKKYMARISWTNL